ncbi:MAG TPA: hypothetical protein VK699_05530 [Terriglobales bacterium]|jgi:hypothetical protein|nr:hypothetical protein [Terriglobales bacterium]
MRKHTRESLPPHLRHLSELPELHVQPDWMRELLKGEPLPDLPWVEDVWGTEYLLSTSFVTYVPFLNNSALVSLHEFCHQHGDSWGDLQYSIYPSSKTGRVSDRCLLDAPEGWLKIIIHPYPDALKSEEMSERKADVA